MKKEYMSSRQRVTNAIEHKPVDRMPIDLGVHFLPEFQRMLTMNFGNILDCLLIRSR